MQPTSGTPTSSTRQVELAIGGMSCGHCIAAVTRALAELPGVEVQRVAVGAATVTLDPVATSADGLVEAIREAGYEARVADRPLPQALPQAPGGSCCSTRSA